MIVKCDKCQTRFKIPDEKVTEKGVKVRCTRCQNTFRVSKSVPVAGEKKSDTDPFARFGSPDQPDPLEATRPGVFPEGIAATRPPLAPSYTAQSDLPPELFELPTRVAPVPKDLLEATPPAPPARSGAPAAPPVPAGFDPSNPFDASDPFALPPVPPPDLLSSAPNAVDRAVSTIPDFPPPLPARTTEPSTHPLDSLLGDLPAADGPFATESAEQDLQPDRGLFDMPLAPPPTAAPPAPVDELVVPPAAAPRSSASSTAFVERPTGRPEDVGMVDVRRPGGLRSTVGMVVNLGVASVLVVLLLSVGTIYLNEGKLNPSVLSLEPVKALFASPGDLRPLDVSNGLYDTAGGKPVFYVRGEVENRGDKPLGAKVRVQILDGATSVTEAEAFAGRAPNPEELYAVTNAETLAALTRQLDQAAVEVKPKSRVPFLVAFYEYPPELADYRLKVTVEQAPGEAAAR